MKVLWIKGRDHISFIKPFVFLVLGSRGEGKSTLLETFGVYHLLKGHKILDLFGSRDGENLAWLRSHYVKDRSVLLIRGDNTDINSCWDSKQISKVTLKDIEDHDITISSSPLYSDPDTEFMSVAHMTDLVYQRLSWNKIIYTIIREASNLYYSRLKITRNQQLAKAQEIYLLRESRHMGLSMGMDTLKFTSIDLDVRSVCDFQLFKSLGLLGLPHDLEWVYGFIEPRILRNMKKGEFVILSKNSAVGLGTFGELSWHKQEREHILKQLDIRVEHGTPIQEARDRGTFFTVSDKEHATIIEAYVSGQSMSQISKKINRSSRTTSEHLHKHDIAVSRSSFCPTCQRIKCQHANSKVLRTVT